MRKRRTMRTRINYYKLPADYDTNRTIEEKTEYPQKITAKPKFYHLPTNTMWEITNEASVKLYTIAIKDENDQTNPVIQRREKLDWKVVLTPVKWLIGKFKRVELSTYHSDKLNEDKENINVYLWDKDGEYKLSTAWTSIGRNILNSLAGEKGLGELTIKVYAKAGIDGKMRPRVSIYNDWQMTSWKLSVEEQKALVEPITKKDGSFVSNDYTALDEKLTGFIEEINKKAKFVQEKEAEKILEEATKDKDLPF